MIDAGWNGLVGVELVHDGHRWRLLYAVLTGAAGAANAATDAGEKM